MGDMLSSASGSPTRDEPDEEERGDSAPSNSAPTSAARAGHATPSPAIDTLASAQTAPARHAHNKSHHNQRSTPPVPAPNQHQQQQQENLVATLAGSTNQLHRLATGSPQNAGQQHQDNGGLFCSGNAQQQQRQQQVDFSLLTQQLGQHFDAGRNQTEARQQQQQQQQQADQALLASSLFGADTSSLFAAAAAAQQSKAAGSPSQSCQHFGGPLGSAPSNGAAGAAPVSSNATAPSNSMLAPNALDDGKFSAPNWSFSNWLAPI